MRRPPLALLLALLLLAACRQDMRDQSKYRDYSEAPLLPRNQSVQDPVPGTVARGDLALEAIAAHRPAMSAALLQRGHERFDIFCAPCHGRAGDGAGMIVQRGFPQPPSYHIDRLRQAPDQHFFEVITHGHGVMYSYAARVPPADRWAIVAYIRALQLSQHAEAATLPDAVRRHLAETSP